MPALVNQWAPMENRPITASESALIISRLIAGAFMSSPVILFVLASSGVATVPPEAQISLTPERQSVVLLSAVAALIIALRIGPQAYSPLAPSTQAVIVRFVLSWAIADGIAVIGFVLALLCSELQWSGLLSVGAVGVIARGWPRAEHFPCGAEEPR